MSGYVRNPSLDIPTDPRFYDSLASSTADGVVDAIGEVAKGGFQYVKNRADMDDRKQRVYKLKQALMDQGLTPAEAEAAALDYVRTDKFTTLTAMADTKKIATEIAAKKAETAQTEATTREVAPNAAASRASLGASTAKTQTETEMLPRGMAVDETNARTDQERVGGDLAIRNRDLDARIDKETRDFALQSDADRSGSIDPKEARDLLIRNRAMVREKVRKVRMQKESYDDGPDEQRYRAMDATAIDEEAKRLTQEAIDDINFGNANAMDIANGGGKAGGGGDDTQKALAEISKFAGQTPSDPEGLLAFLKGKYPSMNEETIRRQIGL